MRSYIAAGVVAAVTTFLATFVVRALAPRVGLMQAPNERSVHERPIRTGGGTAMFLGFLLAMGVASRLPRFRPLFEGSSEPLGVVLAASMIFFVGLADDFKAWSAPAKAAGQVLAGTVLYFLGVTMFYFRVPFADFIVLSPDLAPLATVLWVYGMATAVNFIDGLDGLAAGIVAIAAAGFFVYADRLAANGLLAPDNVGPLLAIITVGACVGFLPHNFHPARIIMGDAGALFLGLMMASSTLVVGGRIADQFSGQTFFFFAPIFIPFFILGVPMVDTMFAIVRRRLRGNRASAADAEHLHHRLMRLGHGQRRSVLILWAWTAILSALVLYPTFTNRGNHLIPLGAAALGVALYTLFHPGIRGREEIEGGTEDPEADYGGFDDEPEGAVPLDPGPDGLEVGVPADLRLLGQVDEPGSTGQAHPA